MHPLALGFRHLYAALTRPAVENQRFLPDQVIRAIADALYTRISSYFALIRTKRRRALNRDPNADISAQVKAACHPLLSASTEATQRASEMAYMYTIQ